jgi:hypothetical protein
VLSYQHFMGWLTILIMSLGLQADYPQEGEALVCTDPVRLEIGAGEISTIRILLVNAHNIYGIDLQATFDPAVVEVVDADTQKTGVQMISGEFLKPDFAIRNVADNNAGTLRYVVTQLNPSAPATGKGTILLIQFRGKVSGTSTKLTINSAVIADRSGTKQPVTTQGANLVIVSAKSLAATAPATPNFIPADPTWPGATLTSTRSRLSAQANTNAISNNPATQPRMTAHPINPAWIPETGPAVSDQVLSYVTVGCFSGAILLCGLSVWLLASKPRKVRTGKSK